MTVDTTISHLGGVLGLPTWIILPAVPDWRWLMGRENSPWYRSVRLWRQPRPGEWADVAARVAEGVREVARKAD